MKLDAVPVFFAPEMVARPGATYSPSAAKPAAVVERWRAAGLPVEIVRPAPATTAELCAAHDAGYVNDVLTRRRPNGFGDVSGEVAASLPYTSGAMLSAARAARASGAVACAPCSGFHHAGFDHGGGFCTFNGLMVAAAALRAEGARRVGILDADMHYGDGTDDILRRLGAEGWVQHLTFGARYGEPKDAAPFLRELPAEVARFEGCDVLLYQAGADPHVDDPLGGWLTTAELRARDEIVFRVARACRLPVAWNLAGGYQRDAAGGIGPVLAIHENTMRACAEAWSFSWAGGRAS
jgi:acetoin utilization deacetylase AcuC-like enzyme